MDIPSGGYVTISSVEGEKSIILTTENGDTSNVFSKGVRTGGENGEATSSSRYRPASSLLNGMVSASI